jgi:hypothetical protein
MPNKVSLAAAPKYVEFTEESNAVDYLEKTLGFIKTAARSPVEWKWVVLAIHGALYGFMICTLKGTDRDNVCVTTKGGGVKLIDFRAALKRCQQPELMSISGFTNVLQLTHNEHLALNMIHNDFRNQFLHYRPALWWIEVTGMPFVTDLGLDVLRKVALDMGGYYADYNREKVAKLIARGKQLLQKNFGMPKQG